jgi:peptide/nickel transport system substrate-binding protein
MKSFGALRTRRAALAAIVFAAMAVGATSAVAARTGESARSAAPTDGGTLRIAMTSDVQLLDPANTGQTQWLYDNAVYNTLTVYGKKGGRVLKPQPELAASWTFSKNAKALTFKLRKGVKFHDGKEFTSADVAYSISRLNSPKVLSEAGNATQLTQYAAKIAHMRTPDKYTVRFTFKQPEPSIFDFFDKLYIVDKNTIDGPDGNSKANGTGPFMLKSWTPGQGYELVKNPHYFKKGLPHLDGVSVKIVPSQQTRYLQFKAGQVDLAPNLDPTTLASLDSDKSGSLAVGCPVNNFYIKANVKNPPLDNQLVRQAINHGINRVRFVQQILANHGSPIIQAWGPVSPAYNKLFNVSNYFDLGYAKQLLIKSGVSLPISVELDTNANQPVLAQLAQIMQSDLQPIGVNLTIKTVTAAQFQSYTRTRDYPGLIAGPYGNPCLSPTAIFPEAALTPDPTINSSNWNDPKYATLVDAVQRATEPKAQKTAYNALTRYLLTTSFFMPVATQVQTFAVGRNVHGFTGNRLNGTYALETTWMSG